MKQASMIFVIILSFFSCTEDKVLDISMKDDVLYLADDKLMGRETGTEGEIMAAEYIAERMEQIGLSPKGTAEYYQDYTFINDEDPHAEATFKEEKSDSTLTGRNVIGYIDNGADQTIVIGAHYDHLGYGGEGSLERGEEEHEIHNGADDNASGVAIVLDLAKDLQGINTNNNYLFMAFSGEEMGLYGSNYFVKNATIDLSSVNYMINLDMVGRLNEEKSLAIHGVGTSPVFKQTLFANNSYDFDVVEKESGIGPSDFTSFYLNDIPVLHFFTGQHEDYHKPSDDAEKLNYEGMELISNYIMDIITDLDNDGELAFKKTKNESEEVPKFNVTLGVVPDYLYSGEGMRIDGVSEEKPAQIAGLQKGDIVKQMDTVVIADMMSYMKALSVFTPGQMIIVAIERDGKLIEKEVTFLE